VFGEENACVVLLERGAVIQEEIWHKLLILSLNQDLLCYPRLALKAGINLHHPEESTKISLHKAVACDALKVLKFYADNFEKQKLIEMIKGQDYMGYTVIDLAKKSENP
jgi:hypothetical protein